MFIVAVFIIANIWKQAKCPSTDEWIKMWYLYTMKLAIKKNVIMPFAATWVDLPIVIVSKSNRKTNII